MEQDTQYYLKFFHLFTKKEQKLNMNFMLFTVKCKESKVHVQYWGQIRFCTHVIKYLNSGGTLASSSIK